MLKTIIIILVAIIVISYLGIDLQRAVESEQSQRNLGYVKALVITVWERYLKRPAEYLWDIFVNLIWNPSIESYENIKDNRPTRLQLDSPQVPYGNGGAPQI